MADPIFYHSDPELLEEHEIRRTREILNESSNDYKLEPFSKYPIPNEETLQKLKKYNPKKEYNSNIDALAGYLLINRMANYFSNTRPGTKFNTIKINPYQIPSSINETPQIKKALNNLKIDLKLNQPTSLPASQPNIQKNLIQHLDFSPITIIQGKTGSGKTTEIPRQTLRYFYDPVKRGYTYHDIIENKDKPIKIICLEPTILSTRRTAQYVSQKYKFLHGNGSSIVGYQHKGLSTVNDNTNIIYSTDGLFLAQLLRNPNTLFDYNAIIIDEVHERNANIDYIMNIIRISLIMAKEKNTQQLELTKTNNPQETEKQIIQMHLHKISQKIRKMKIILMSATAEIDTLTKYFHFHRPFIMTIPGSSCLITQEHNYSSALLEVTGFKREEKLYQIITDIVKHIQTISVEHKCRKQNKLDNTQNNDIIIFLPKENYLIKAMAELNKHPEIKQNYDIKLLHSKLDIEEQEQAIKPLSNNKHKIILATDYAKTGITITGLKFVIDSGLSYQAGYNHKMGYETLDIDYISQSDSIQREGRIGREEDGLSYLLYKQNALKTSTHPEIINSRLDYNIFKLYKHYTFQNAENTENEIKNFFNNLITPPSNENLNLALKQLINAGMINDKFKLTEIGKCASRLGINYEFAKLLIYSKIYDQKKAKFIQIIPTNKLFLWISILANLEGTSPRNWLRTTGGKIEIPLENKIKSYQTDENNLGEVFILAEFYNQLFKNKDKQFIFENQFKKVEKTIRNIKLEWSNLEKIKCFSTPKSNNLLNLKPEQAFIEILKETFNTPQHSIIATRDDNDHLIFNSEIEPNTPIYLTSGYKPFVDTLIDISDLAKNGPEKILIINIIKKTNIFTSSKGVFNPYWIFRTNIGTS